MSRSGKGGLWKYRDHGHFICFAPFDKPRYACAVVIEHGGGSSAAYPVARDVMTFLFDPAKAMDVLTGMEAGWGGTPQERMATKYRAYAAQYGIGAPEVPKEEQEKPTEADDQASDAPPQEIVRDAQTPPPEPVAETGQAAGVTGPGASPTPEASPAGMLSPGQGPLASPSPAQ